MRRAIGGALIFAMTASTVPAVAQVELRFGTNPTIIDPDGPAYQVGPREPGAVQEWRRERQVAPWAQRKARREAREQRERLVQEGQARAAAQAAERARRSPEESLQTLPPPLEFDVDAFQRPRTNPAPGFSIGTE